MVVAVVLSVPLAARADEGDVARIGETTYTTLDDAIDAAEDGATIELLSSATTNGINLSKDLTIQAAEGLAEKPSITFEEYGIALWGTQLTFKDCDVIMEGIGSTPYKAEWNWMTICASQDATLSLDNVDMTMDGSGIQADGDGKHTHAIYFCSNNVLNLSNNSSLSIKNYSEDALEWDGGNEGYNVNITDSTYISDNNRSGFTGTFYATISNSKVEVKNSSGNGSNGTYYTIKDGSEVLFENNGSWGISAYRIDMSGKSKLTAKDNAYSGIWTRILNVDESCTVDVEHNGFKGACDSDGTQTGSVSNAGILFWGHASEASRIDKGAVLTIKDNAGSGINTRQGICDFTVLSGSISNNGINAKGAGAEYGGGVYNVGTMVIGEGVEIYNNHAGVAGDDIFNNPSSDSKSITFGKVVANKTLDGEPDCAHAIDGWYDDSDDARWEAHATSEDGNHAVEFDKFDLNNMATVEGSLALKAAHGLEPLKPGEGGSDAWEKSKSKTATNLDEKYESEVTLSLPSEEEELVSDIVFVLDESSCTEPVKAEASKMLESLYERAESEGATIKIGAVQFRGEVTEFPLTELSEETKNDLAGFMGKRPEVAGSNMSMGLIAGKAMLDGDKEVDASRKYLILVGDGITYTWDDETTEVPENYGVNFANGDAPNTPMLAGPDGWDVKYGKKYVPTDWNQWLKSAESLLEKTINDKASVYTRTEDPADQAEAIKDLAFVPNAEKDLYLSTVDIALYKSYQVYSEIAKSYKVFVVDEGVESEMASFPFGPSFMQFMAGGKTFDFGQIEKEIYYLLDDGSEVVDVIGYGTDNHGNSYNFDFVNEIDRLTLTVGGKELNKELIVDTQMTDPNATSAYGFFSGDESGEKYDFELYYYEKGQDGNSDECFVWKINVPVSNFAPVQLTYAVKLTNPQPDEGVYGQYDGDGSKNYSGLYTNYEATLYPVDSNDDEGRPELFPKPTVSYSVGEATIAPVDITIYKGGDEGYEGVVDDGGATLEANDSLPEPGFYLQLPEWINTQLETVQQSDKTAAGYINLSDYVTITAKTIDGDNREWELHPYGESHPTSYASGGYIYRIEPAAEGTDELRLQFKDENGVRVDDNFTPATALKNEYTMSVFGDGIATDSIELHINVPADNTTDGTPINIDCGLGADSGTLTIRYVSGEQNAVTTDVVSENKLDDALATNPDKAVATVPEGTTFFINESNVDLDSEEGPLPSLLFDQIVDSGDTTDDESDGYAAQLEQGAISLVNANLENPQAESRYLDLVDVNNGNVWLTANKPVTVYWPRPENSTETTKFYLVHFDGFDREMNTDQVSDLIQQALSNTDNANTDGPRAYEVEQVDNLGDTIRFTTETFSPFVLVWDASNGGSTDPEPPVTDYYGDLKVSKTVTGNLANLNDEFTFRVTVEGAGDQTYGGVKFTDDVATITLNGGQTVTIKNLPKGSKYTVEEIDGLDYELVSSKNTSGTIPFSSVTASFVNDKSEPETLDPSDPVNPGGSKVLLDADGNPVALAGGEFTFKLTGLDGAPMPAGAVDGSITVTNRADGVFVFGDIVFDEAGTYTYELTEVAGTDEGITYDGSTHTLVVVVSDEDADGDGKLDIASLTYDGESTLPTFTNETTSDEPPAPDSDQPGTDEPAEPTTPGVPDTGDHTVSALPAVLALGGVALVGGAIAVARRRVR